MFLDDGDEDLVSQRSRSAKIWMRLDDDRLGVDAAIERDAIGSHRGTFRIVAEQGAGYAQQRVLHVEFVDRRRRLHRVCFSFFQLHDGS